MQLRKVQVNNWRGVETATLEFGDGITIVGGQNESGKSTIRDALRSGYLLPQKGDRKSLEKKRPWGADVFPSVKIEFQLNGQSWMIQKDFLRKKGWAELRHQGKLVAEDEQVQPRLFEELGSRTEWIDTLWASQGDIVFSKPIPESVKGCLATAARDSVMPEVKELEKLILDDYSNFWTQQGRVIKAVQMVRTETDERRKAVTEAERQLKLSELASEKIETLKVDVGQKKGMHAELVKQYEIGKSSVQLWSSYRTAQSEASKLDTQHGQIKTALDACKSAFSQIIDLHTKSNDWQQQVRELKLSLKNKPTDTDLRALRATLSYCDALHKYQDRLEIESIHTPSDEELRELLAVESELRAVSANLKAGELKARVIAESDVKISIKADNKKEEIHTLAKADSSSFSAERAFQFELPGIVKLEVESGSQSAQLDIDRRDELESSLKKALDDYSVESLQALQERTIQKQAQLSLISPVKESTLRELEAAVPDPKSIKALSKAERIDTLEQLTTDVSALEQSLKLLGEQFEAQQNQLNSLLGQAVSAQLKAKLENQQTQISVLKSLFNGIPDAPSKANAVQRCDESVALLQSLLKGCDQIFSTDELSSQVKPLLSFTEAWSSVLSELSTTSSKLRTSVSKPEGDETTEAALNSIESEIQKLSQQIEQLDAELNQSIGTMSNQQPMYSLHVAAMEALAAAESQEEQTNTNAQCIEILKKAFEHAKKKLQEDVVMPLQTRVTARLRVLTNNHYKTAFVNEALRVVALAPQHVDSVEFEEISFGTQEQLTFLCRLSLAELLTESTERLTVILDDNLVHSDEERMSIMCKMLEEASENVQIIIFTCHPNRYDPIKNKTVLSLPRISDKSE